MKPRGAATSAPAEAESGAGTVFFVHGMGRSSLSGWWMLHSMRQSGFVTSTFDYRVSTTSFDAIVERLAAALRVGLERRPLILVGHSLGGVLLRAALQLLPERLLGRVRRLFLLGSPVRATRLAVRLRPQRLYRWLTGDCGQRLGSEAAMAAVGRPQVPTTAIVGTRGIWLTRAVFGRARNDGVVAVAEASAPWLSDHLELPIVHSLLPWRRRVADVIRQRLEN